MDTAVKEYPELVKKYFMTDCVPASDHKFTALHGAVWSGAIRRAHFHFYDRRIDSLDTLSLGEGGAGAGGAVYYKKKKFKSDNLRGLTFLWRVTICEG